MKRKKLYFLHIYIHILTLYYIKGFYKYSFHTFRKFDKYIVRKHIQYIIQSPRKYFTFKENYQKQSLLNILLKNLYVIIYLK